jgi:DNA-binding LytR/AlgR family response regulator
MKEYVKIFLMTAKKPVITQSTLNAIEGKSSASKFIRVHKSFIVRLDKIELIRSQTIFIGAHEIPVSDTYLEVLMRTLNHFSWCVGTTAAMKNL